MRFYQVDSFTDKLFRGNPAGVVLLEHEWPSVPLMQSIAAEVNLSETAFVLPWKTPIGIRWFTPTAEVPLCGHATLAAGHVLLRHAGHKSPLEFAAKKGALGLYAKGDELTLDFPADKIWQIDFEDVVDCFGVKPVEVWRGTDEYMLVFESKEQVANAVCDLAKAAQVDLNGIIITAKSDKYDFVSRYFTPKFGIDEDPVTGSAHTLLAPYWAGRLDKTSLHAAQISKRGGELFCSLVGERVHIAGYAVTFLEGRIHI